MRNFRLTAAAALLTALIAGPSWSYTPGTYEASAQGMKGPVKVAVTFSKDAVTSVKVIEEKETAGMGRLRRPNFLGKSLKPRAQRSTD